MTPQKYSKHYSKQVKKLKLYSQLLTSNYQPWLEHVLVQNSTGIACALAKIRVRCSTEGSKNRRSERKTESIVQIYLLSSSKTLNTVIFISKPSLPPAFVALTKLLTPQKYSGQPIKSFQARKTLLSHCCFTQIYLHAPSDLHRYLVSGEIRGK